MYIKFWGRSQKQIGQTQRIRIKARVECVLSKKIRSYIPARVADVWERSLYRQEGLAEVPARMTLFKLPTQKSDSRGSGYWSMTQQQPGATDQIKKTIGPSVHGTLTQPVSLFSSPSPGLSLSLNLPLMFIRSLAEKKEC